MTQRADVPAGQARAVLAWAPGLIDHRYEHRGMLATAAWALRANLTFYDALYVALAGPSAPCWSRPMPGCRAP